MKQGVSAAKNGDMFTHFDTKFLFTVGIHDLQKNILQHILDSNCQLCIVPLPDGTLLLTLHISRIAHIARIDRASKHVATTTATSEHAKKETPVDFVLSEGLQRAACDKTKT